MPAVGVTYTNDFWLALKRSEINGSIFETARSEPLNAFGNHHIQSNMKLRMLPLLLSFALVVGCAGEFQSMGSGSSAASDSSSDSWNETQARINQQTALDAANAAAQQQNNDATAAAQQTMNQHNDEFNRGMDLHQ